MLLKPDDVFGRDSEWEDLSEFAESTLPGLRIAVVYGRRRQGKSYLLRRLADACGGLYHLATEQTETISVRRFAESLAAWHGLPVGSLSFDGWEQALTGAVRMMARRAGPDARCPPLLVLDEFGYLVRETPGLPSIVSALYDETGPGSASTRAPFRLVLCGSATAVMSDLLSGTKALRGRAALELRVRPFDFRTARRYWGIDDVHTAFVHNALVGGTPGYRDLVMEPAVPTEPAGRSEWVARNLLRPTAPLFDEARRIVHEDPRIRDTAVYGSLLAAVAAGESSPAKIGGLLGRSSTSLTHQLTMLESAGFVERRADLLLHRRPVITVADPIIRLHHLVVEPNLSDLEAGRAGQVWAEVTRTVDSKILGPHLESLATAWVTDHARDEAGLQLGTTGPAHITCPEHRITHEVDVLALRRGSRPRTAGAEVAFIGAAKAGRHVPDQTQLQRLEHIRDLLTAGGHDATGAVLGLFSTRGFAPGLARDAGAADGRILLAGLDQLYGLAAAGPGSDRRSRRGGRGRPH